MQFVTVEQARQHLRSDSDADDGDLALKIKAASKAVWTYLKSSPLIEVDSSGQPIVGSDDVAEAPEDIQIATLMLIGIFYRDREGDTGTGASQRQINWQPGYLPPQVTALLYPYRDPTLA